uniref:Uncharacterized protein n=1 Tax=Candidatus Kentrum sp. MB TaxID=2138164 RepID=A0A450XIS8_9GAMM|nr:MAG: hypothetical protein BECKMB1821G_GA0114241_104625 [Candidatus Kentron sp. MB]
MKQQTLFHSSGCRNLLHERLSTSRCAGLGTRVLLSWKSRWLSERTGGLFAQVAVTTEQAMLLRRWFEFVPLWGIKVFLAYALRRVNCKRKNLLYLLRKRVLVGGDGG